MFVIDRSLYLSPEVVGEPGPKGPLKEADPFSLEALVAWLEKQDGATEYNWRDIHDCLMHHYFSDVFRAELHGTFPSAMGFELGCWFDRPFKNLGEYHGVAAVRPWTFADAKDRARKLLAEREK